MKLKHFGDSYDIVKKSMLQWLEPFGPWVAHPMFTEPFSPRDAAAFSKFLGVPLISTEVLLPTTDRVSYFNSSSRYRSLFLDPDTGVRLAYPGERDWPRYLFQSELQTLSYKRPNGLLLIFDQSLPRGGEAAALRTKFEYLAKQNVHGFAYMSHASFIVAGSSASLVDDARKSILTASRLPNHRLISLAA